MREKKYANHCPIISPPGALVNGPDASTGSFAYGRLTPPTPNTHRHPRNRTGTRFLFPLSKMKIWPDWYSVMMDPFRLASRVDEMQSSRQTIAVLGNFSCFSFTFTEFPWVHVKLMKFEKKLSPRRFFLARFKWKPQKIRLPDSDVPLWEIKIPKRGETLRWIGGDNEDQATTKNRTRLTEFYRVSAERLPRIVSSARRTTLPSYFVTEFFFVFFSLWTSERGDVKRESLSAGGRCYASVTEFLVPSFFLRLRLQRSPSSPEAAPTQSPPLPSFTEFFFRTNQTLYSFDWI